LKYLALDIGEKWVGVAISDSGLSHSFPYKTLAASELEQQLVKIVSQEEVSKIVYGLPYTLKGEQGLQLKKVEAKVLSLKSLSQLQSIAWVGIDERFSSQGAIFVLHQQNKKIGDNKSREHSIVAALLLQSYLDANLTRVD